jgi:hypothetical protein
MPSGVKVDWRSYDNIIRTFLPTMTIADFALLYFPNISKKAVGARAKKLGVKPARKKLSVAHKLAISNSCKKPLEYQHKEYVKENANKISRGEIAKNLGISLYLVNNIFSDLGIAVDQQFMKKVQAAKSKEHVHLATTASAKRWEDNSFRLIRSKSLSSQSKRLWESEKYRCKVRKGILEAYNNTDLKQRLSEIGKCRYNQDRSVRDILHANRPFKNSKLNDRVAIALDAHDISYVREFEVANYKVDFKIGDILLEVQGDYWHNLPVNKRNDSSKATIIRRYYPQYDLKFLWESEFNRVRGVNRLLEIIGFKQPDPEYIGLNELEFELFDDLGSTKRFLDSYHYLGWTNRASLIFRMHYEKETIILSLFGSPIRPNTAPGKVLELIRLCRHPYFFNKNMASNFLSKCVKKIRKLKKYDNLVSFSDDRLHLGTIYKATNWHLVGKTQSDYQYLSNTNIPMHKKTLYNRAKRANMTEREYANQYGYKKTHIGTKTKFVFHLNKSIR